MSAIKSNRTTTTTEAALEVARVAVLNELAWRPSVFWDLMRVCGFERLRYTADGMPESRVLDRTLQKLKKEGAIRFEGKKWHLNFQPKRVCVSHLFDANCPECSKHVERTQA